MNKKRAKFNFVLTSILLVLALILCFAQFKLPGSNNYFNGLINSITTGADISNGYSAVYKITEEDVTEEEINQTIELLRTILFNQGLDSVNVYKQGDAIRAEVQSKGNASEILTILGNSKTFYISELDQNTITEEELQQYDIVGPQITKAYATTQANMDKTINGITIEFTKSGQNKYKELTKKVSAKASEDERKLTFYLDGQKLTSLTGVEESSDNKLSFYYQDDGSENTMTYQAVKTLALQILMSSTGVNLEVVSNNTTTATMGANTLKLMLIVLAVILLAILIVMPCIYGDLGFVADLSILIGAVLNVFILQALPLTTSSLTGIVGSIIGMGLLVACHVLYLNNMRSQFKLLKKLQLSARTGFKKSWLGVLDITSIAFIGALALGLWNIQLVSTFGISLAIGAFIALFNTIVVFKDLITWYVYINPKNYKRVKFTKEEGNE